MKVSKLGGGEIGCLCGSLLKEGVYM